MRPAAQVFAKAVCADLQPLVDDGVAIYKARDVCLPQQVRLASIVKEKAVPALLMGLQLCKLLAQHGTDWEVCTVLMDSQSCREMTATSQDVDFGRLVNLGKKAIPQR